MEPSEQMMFARVVSSGGRNHAGIRTAFGVVFADAAYAESSFWVGRSFVLLPPGYHRFFAISLAGEHLFALRRRLIAVSGELKTGIEHKIAGRLEEGRLSYWLQESATGERINAVETVDMADD